MIPTLRDSASGDRTDEERVLMRDALLRPVGRYGSERASQLAGIPRRTLNHWCYTGVYEPDFPGGRFWSYRDLVLVRVLAWLRSKGMAPKDAADRVRTLKHRLEDPSVSFTSIRSQGRELLAGTEAMDYMTGELLMPEVVKFFSQQTLSLQLDRGASTRWWPDLVRPNAHVAIRPLVMSGEPCIIGTRITTQAMFELAEGRGLSPADIVNLYPGRTVDEVTEAIGLERRLREAA